MADRKDLDDVQGDSTDDTQSKTDSVSSFDEEAFAPVDLEGTFGEGSSVADETVAEERDATAPDAEDENPPLRWGETLDRMEQRQRMEQQQMDEASEAEQSQDGRFEIPDRYRQRLNEMFMYPREDQEGIRKEIIKDLMSDMERNGDLPEGITPDEVRAAAERANRISDMFDADDESEAEEPQRQAANADTEGSESQNDAADLDHAILGRLMNQLGLTEESEFRDDVIELVNEVLDEENHLEVLNRAERLAQRIAEAEGHDQDETRSRDLMQQLINGSVQAANARDRGELPPEQDAGNAEDDAQTFDGPGGTISETSSLDEETDPFPDAPEAPRRERADPFPDIDDEPEGVDLNGFTPFSEDGDSGSGSDSSDSSSSDTGSDPFPSGGAPGGDDSDGTSTTTSGNDSTPPEEIDILKMIEFLKSGDKKTAMQLAMDAARDMRAEGRSNEPAKTIAKNLFQQATQRYRALVEAVERRFKADLQEIAAALAKKDEKTARRLASNASTRLYEAGGKYADISVIDILKRALEIAKKMTPKQTSPASGGTTASAGTTDIPEQLAAISDALDKKDGQRARALAEALAKKLRGKDGPFGDMDAVAILKYLLRKKKKKDDDASTVDSTDTDSTNGPGSDFGDGSPDRRPPSAGAALTVQIIKQCDWDKFCEVYSTDPAEIDELKAIATKIVKKGVDATAVIKSGKDLLTRAKKKKSGAKFKNGVHVCAAIEDIMLRKTDGKKLAKALKASDIPEEDDIAA